MDFKTSQWEDTVHCWDAGLNLQQFLAHGLRLKPSSQSWALCFLCVGSRHTRKLHCQVRRRTEAEEIWAVCLWQADTHGLHKLASISYWYPIRFETPEEEIYICCFSSTCCREGDHNKELSNPAQTSQAKLLAPSWANDQSHRMLKVNGLEKPSKQNNWQPKRPQNATSNSFHL